jgi:signal peptidase I
MTDSTPETEPHAESSGPPEKKPKPEKENLGLWRGWVRPLLTVLIVVTALRSSLVDWNDVPTGSMIPTVLVGDRIVVNKLAYGFNLPFNGPAIVIPFVNVGPFYNPLDFLPGFYYATPKRNDIVTFWKPDTTIDGMPIDDGGIRMVKRVVAGPGDTVEMRPAVGKFDGRLFHFSKLVLNGVEATYTKRPGVELTETIEGDTRHVQYMRNLRVEDRLGQPQPFPLHPQAYEFGPYTLGDDEYFMIGDNRDNSQDGRFFGPVTLKHITGKAKFVAVSFHGSYLDPNWGRFFHGFAVEGIRAKK